jgi:coenzyme Q-binding protein COQ10
MFDLVADVERYPEFLPLCEALTVRSRKERDGKTLLIADMTVGYKAIRETFTSQVLLKPDDLAIDVKYLDGPFKYLDNKWRFDPRAKWRLRSLLLHRLRIQEQGAGRADGCNVRSRFPHVRRSLRKRAREIYGQARRCPENAES